MRIHISRKAMIVSLLCAAVAAGMISGCGNESKETSSSQSIVIGQSSKAESTVSVTSEDSDSSYNDSETVKIDLNGESASVEGNGAKAENGKITVSSGGTYLISGKLSKGQIVINAGKDDTVKLILSNADITGDTGAAIYSQKCGKTIIVLEKDTVNTVTEGKAQESDDSDAPDAAIYAQDDLTILGEGKLTVNAGTDNGITSKDTLIITGGNIDVAAGHHGITGKDNLHISGGTINVKAEGDGLRSTYSDTDDDDKGHIYIENADITITSANDAVQAEKNLSVKSGNVTITSGSGAGEAKTDEVQQMPFGNNKQTDSSSEESAKGLKAGCDLTISGGTFTIDSADDSLHANGNISISGGTIKAASGDDGVHADDTINISGGNITVSQSYEGLEAVNINITGGTADITASDDGVNCSGGNDGSGFGGRDGNMNFGGRMQRPDMHSGENSGDDSQQMPQMPDGQAPQMPDGQAPQTPDGQAPQMPDGQAPQTTGNENSQDGSSGNETGALNISGGTLYVTAQGDGLDSNGDLNIKGGTVVINGTTRGGNGIIDHNGGCTVSGGTLIGAGTSDMLEMPSENSEQNTAVILFDSAREAGSLVYITDSDGNILFAMAPEKSYSCIIFSSDKLTKNSTYKVYTDGTASGSSIHGYYSSSTISGGQQYCEFTQSSTVTYANSSGNTAYSGGMGGGMRGAGGTDRGRQNNGQFPGNIQNDQSSAEDI